MVAADVTKLKNDTNSAKSSAAPSPAPSTSTLSQPEDREEKIEMDTEKKQEVDTKQVSDAGWRPIVS